MTQKDLADEYAEKEYKRVNGDSAPIFTDETCFTFDDIKAAFSAGRESAVESLPELEWKRVYKDGPYLAVTVFNWFYRIEFVYNKFNLFCNSYYISCYLSLLAAKQAANEHYKKQIERALRL
ncbi:hypothetical protein [Prevotella pallens]|uniref:hypothetical protein n=1 Tax=Prevotella pallens TaxID=60133 RepID=UPI0028DC5917|nr:hypothetical protein [Prevotella pallens]